MHNFSKYIALGIGLVSGIANAAVVAPKVDIGMVDTADYIAVTDTSLAIDATAFAVIGDDGVITNIADIDFKLTADNGTRVGNITIYSAGQLAIEDQLTADFSTLQIFWLSDTVGNIQADLNYLSGNWMNGLNSGRFEAAFSLSENGDILSAKAGEVAVPVPGALALISLPLLGLFGFTRRRESIR